MKLWLVRNTNNNKNKRIIIIKGFDAANKFIKKKESLRDYNTSAFQH